MFNTKRFKTIINYLMGQESGILWVIGLILWPLSLIIATVAAFNLRKFFDEDFWDEPVRYVPSIIMAITLFMILIVNIMSCLCGDDPYYYTQDIMVEKSQTFVITDIFKDDSVINTLKYEVGPAFTINDRMTKGQCDARAIIQMAKEKEDKLNK